MIAGAFASALILSSAAAPALAADPVTLTVQEQAQAQTLATQVLQLIKATSPTSSKLQFEGVILGATSGKPCVVVKAAIVIVKASAGLPSAAIEAATDVSNSCGGIGAVGAGPTGGPAFGGGGGGGSNYSL